MKIETPDYEDLGFLVVILLVAVVAALLFWFLG